MLAIFISQQASVEFPYLTLAVSQRAKHAVFARNHKLQPFSQQLFVEQVADTNPTHATDLILVAGADAPASRTDGGTVASLFAQPFLFHVVGENNVSVVADH